MWHPYKTQNRKQAFSCLNNFILHNNLLCKLLVWVWGVTSHWTGFQSLPGIELLSPFTALTSHPESTAVYVHLPRYTLLLRMTRTLASAWLPFCCVPNLLFEQYKIPPVHLHVVPTIGTVQRVCFGSFNIDIHADVAFGQQRNTELPMTNDAINRQTGYQRSGLPLRVCIYIHSHDVWYDVQHRRENMSYEILIMSVDFFLLTSDMSRFSTGLFLYPTRKTCHWYKSCFFFTSIYIFPWK